jgi:hypothetical protein
MAALERERVLRRHGGFSAASRLIGWSLAGLLLSATALAQSSSPAGAPAQAGAAPVWPMYVVPGEPDVCTLYSDGSQVVAETEGQWKLIGGSDPAGVTTADLKTWAERHEALLREGPVTIIAAPDRGRTSINVVYHAGGGVPPAALPALAAGATYLSSLFSDPITIDVSITFQNMGDPNILGATVVNYNNSQAYTSSRDGLISGMHCYDVIQNWLPTGDHVLVRFNGGSDVVSEQHVINWPKAAFKATMGTTSGYAGSTTFNTQSTWDFDPTDGITSGDMSFMDVLIHETGHALGFVSAVDQGVTMHVMDLFRFQRTDGCCDYNPETYEEFQVRPRLVSFNLPDDDHNTDFITDEYRMSDGDPAQGSHWRDQSPRIGLMAPYISDGQTSYPDYYTAADIAMFDAIGYDYPPCECPIFLEQPQSVNGCLGGNVELSVAVNLTDPGYQWRIGNNPLPEDGHYVGTQTDTLQIVGLSTDDVNDLYNCLVTNLTDGCQHASDYATVGAYIPVTINAQPADATIMEFSNISFSVDATGQAPLTYQWRHNGVDLTNSPTVFGVNTPTVTLLSAQAFQAGFYDCQIENICGPVTSAAAHLQVNTGYGAWRGDLDCDGVVAFGDINPFILALSSGESAYYNSYPNCHFYNGDINQDGAVDFGDINPFVQCIVGGGCP